MITRMPYRPDAFSGGEVVNRIPERHIGSLMRCFVHDPVPSRPRDPTNVPELDWPADLFSFDDVEPQQALAH